MDFGLCQKIANYILRPPRATYQLQDLGPRNFQHRGKIYERVDFQVVNQRHLKLECCLFKEKYSTEERETVIFLHANSSSRLAVKNYLGDLLPFFNVASFDCSGSGLSEGYCEKEDLRSVIKHLKRDFGLRNFILWGRSMGAVTALLYAGKYQDVLTLISDNAFSDLQQTCRQLKDSHLSIFPDFLLDTLLQHTQQYIDEKMLKEDEINFNIKKLKPKRVVQRITCPIFYIYSQSDKIVDNGHTKVLYDLSKYPKRIMSVKGDHNGHRDAQIKGKVIDFLLELSLSRKPQKEQPNFSRKQFGCSQQSVVLASDGCSQQSVPQEDCGGCTVYESPLNRKLCQSYLKEGSKHKKQEPSCKANRIESNRRMPSGWSDGHKSGHIKRQVSLQMPVNQEQYKVQASEVQNVGSSCLDSCKGQKRRKKIFSKDQ